MQNNNNNHLSSEETLLLSSIDIVNNNIVSNKVVFNLSLAIPVFKAKKIRRMNAQTRSQHEYQRSHPIKASQIRLIMYTQVAKLNSTPSKISTNEK